MSEYTDSVVVDLAATCDYVRGEVTERADTFDFDQMVAYQDGLIAVKKTADEALALLRGEMSRQLEEGSRTVGTRTFVRQPKRTRVFDHSRIMALLARHVHDTAPVDENGERDHSNDPGRALAVVQRLYLSTSSTAKVTELDRLEIPRKEVIKSERKGFEIIVIDSDPEDDDE